MNDYTSQNAVAAINSFWQGMGVNVEAYVGRDGEIHSRLTDGLPHVKLPQAKIVAATRGWRKRKGQVL